MCGVAALAMGALGAVAGAMTSKPKQQQANTQVAQAPATTTAPVNEADAMAKDTDKQIKSFRDEQREKLLRSGGSSGGTLLTTPLGVTGKAKVGKTVLGG